MNINENKYNYKLNNVNHEIILNNNLKIDCEPINEKILVSNKYMLKYINDLFDYHNIDYFLLGDTLLGNYVFNGINIFNSTLEIGVMDNFLVKLKKLEQNIKDDDFSIIFYEKYIKISTIFFDKIRVYISIHLLESDTSNDMIRNKLISHEFYDIFPTKKIKFEEFEVSVPNKIDKVLESYGINLNYIIFTKKDKKNMNKKIIEEKEKKETIFNMVLNKINDFLI